MLRKLYSGSGIFIALLLTGSMIASLLMPALASATSDYDEYVVVDTEIRVQNANNTCSQDLTTSYMSILREDPDFQTKWQDSYSNTGAWAVSTYYPGDGQKWVGFNFVADKINNAIQFQSRPGESEPGVSIANWSSSTDGTFYIRAEMQQDGCHYIAASGFSDGQLSYKIGSAYDMRLVFTSFDVTYPTGYEGEQIPGASDLDGDGLIRANESIQSTSDTDNDTDGDGIDDLKESQWYSNRDNVFCGSTKCAYPDPIKRNLYVEVDWMNDGSQDYKPTSGQLDTVIDTFEDQGIIAHFDTGQYGGGAQLPILSEPLIFAPTEDELDFYDLKNGTSTVSAEFSSDRKKIWHYMITGYNYMKSDGVAGSTGSSYAGDDDSVVSIEKIEQLNPSSLDVAIAGTILHELGHNLCLAQTSSIYYLDQPIECVYSEIDKATNPSSNYESVMNYDYQLEMIDYSHGINGAPNDHDDWGAIALGMGDFQNSVFEWDDTQPQQRGSSGQISRQAMIDAIQ